MQVPPLCYKSNNADEKQEPEGVFPKVVSEMIKYVCGTLDCAHKRTIHKRHTHRHERTSPSHNHKRNKHDLKRNGRGHQRAAFKHTEHDHDKTRHGRKRNARDHGDAAYDGRKRSARDQDMTVLDQKTSAQNQTGAVLDFREETINIHNISKMLSVPHTEFTLPISMNPEKQVASEEWVFLPVVKVDGLAMVMRKPNRGEICAGKIGSSVLNCWPAFVMMFVTYCVFGLAVWNLVRRDG